MKKVLIYIGLIIILTILGFLFRGIFIDISFSQLDKRGVKIISSLVNGQFKSHLIFSLSIGVVPLLYLISNKFSKLKSLNQTLTTIGMIFGCGILSWQLKIIQLNNKLQRLSEYDLGNGIMNTMEFQNLSFGRYLFIGFLIGTLLSILLFRIKNRIKT